MVDNYLPTASANARTANRPEPLFSCNRAQLIHRRTLHDAELDTTSPIDRVLFRIADGLRSVERAGAKRPAAKLAREARTKKLEPTAYHRSVIRGAIASGMKPREVRTLAER